MAGIMTSLVDRENFVTLETILNHGRNNKHHEGADFTCRVVVQRIRNNKQWFVLNCGGGRCMRGVEHQDGELWCVGCENPVLFPKASFRLELEVSDTTGSVVIVLLDDAARMLTKSTAGSILAAESGFAPAYNVHSVASEYAFTPVVVENPDGTKTSLPSCLQSLVGSTRTFVIASHTYYHHGGYESFNCKAVVPDCDVPLCVGSSTPTRPFSKFNVVLGIPTPVKQRESTTRVLYADSDSDEDVGCPTHEIQKKQQLDGDYAETSDKR